MMISLRACIGDDAIALFRSNEIVHFEGLREFYVFGAKLKSSYITKAVIRSTKKNPAAAEHHTQHAMTTTTD